MKKLAGVALVLVVLVAGGMFWLRGNVDGLVKTAIEKYGSEMTKASVTVASVEIKAADGRGVIRGLRVGNPAGFHTAHAASVGEIDVAIDVSTLTSGVVSITRIAVTSPDIIYEKGDTTTNFDALQKNIADYVGPSKNQEGGKKLVVGELTVRNAHAQASAAFMKDKTVAVTLPDIVLRDIGKQKGGVTPGELGQEIVAALKQKLNATVSFDRLMKSMSEGLDSASSAIKGLFGK